MGTTPKRPLREDGAEQAAEAKKRHRLLEAAGTPSRSKRRAFGGAASPEAHYNNK